MSLPAGDEIRGLLQWRPPHGVISIYLAIDHGDRGHGWNVALRDGLRAAVAEVEAGGEHDLRVAVRMTAERILERWPADGRPPEGRGLVAFAEVSRNGGEVREINSRGAPRETAVAWGRRPLLRPLIELIDDNRCFGAVALSGEQARLLEWSDGSTSELGDLEILTTGDWREQKAQRPPNPAAGQAVSSSGRDQFQQRMDDNRARFVADVASRVAKLCSDRGWSELVVFADEHWAGAIDDAVAAGDPGGVVTHHEPKNLIQTPLSEIGERLSELIPGYNRAREMKLVERVVGAAAAGGRGALGEAETAQAVTGGRVEHLVLDAGLELSPEGVAPVLGAEAGSEPADPVELLLERALATDAAVTPVEGEAAERLREHGGIGAILRY